MEVIAETIIVIVVAISGLSWISPNIVCQVWVFNINAGVENSYDSAVTVIVIVGNPEFREMHRINAPLESVERLVGVSINIVVVAWFRVTCRGWNHGGSIKGVKAINGIKAVRVAAQSKR